MSLIGRLFGGGNKLDEAASRAVLGYLQSLWNLSAEQELAADSFNQDLATLGASALTPTNAERGYASSRAMADTYARLKAQHSELQPPDEAAPLFFASEASWNSLLDWAEMMNSMFKGVELLGYSDAGVVAEVGRRRALHDTLFASAGKEEQRLLRRLNVPPSELAQRLSRAQADARRSIGR